MKDIFSELYKKVLSFFNNEAKEENSKDTACNRLKLVLMQDRAKMEPALMEKMREEMVAVISKYVEIDKEALDLNLEAEGESFALMLNIPVIRAKTREEIEAAEGIESVDEDDDDDDIEEDENQEDDEEPENETEPEEVSDDSVSADTVKESESAKEDGEAEETTIKKVAEEIKPADSKDPEKISPKPSAPKNKEKHQHDET